MAGRPFYIKFPTVGPLALASSASSFIALSSNEEVHGIGESMRNVCNSTLALLFTIALCVWGFFINRKEAWRTDGGTAIFGAGTVFLSLCSTALNMVTIALEPPGWMPNLVWAVVLWQSFMGWWWWAGSAMPPTFQGGKKKKRKPVGADSEVLSSPRLAKWKSGISSAGRALRRRRSHGEGEDIVRLSPQRSSSSPDSRVTATAAAAAPAPSPAPSPPSQRFWLLDIITFRGRIAAWWENLRHAHSHATRMQALERRHRRFHVYGNQSPDTHGWNLGSYAIREPELPRVESIGTGENIEMGDYGSQKGHSVAGDTVQHSIGPSTSRGRSWLWWGPLGRWRLQDVSVYH